MPKKRPIDMDKIVPVLLSGGAGTRLWPLSRKSYPKQFSKIIDHLSLFQKAAIRLSSSGIVDFEKPLVLTNSEYRFIVDDQLKAVGIDPKGILIEPEQKNTAPAILAASFYAFEENEEAVLLVSPCDHLLPDIEEFHSKIAIGLKEVLEGRIVTFGVAISRPETGYGYLELSEATTEGAFKVQRFVEKPSKQLAMKMFQNDSFFWNAGIFLFRAKDMIDAFKSLCPGLIAPVQAAVTKRRLDLNFFRLASKSWAECDEISIDYAIMEKATNISAVPYSKSWSDLGDWRAVWKEMSQDASGVSLSDNAHSFNCKNTLLRSETGNQEIIGVGLNDIIAISMPDAVLVANKNNVQDVKDAVLSLKSKNIRQAEFLPKDYRPWGWFETLTISKGFQVKRILVNPGAALSLQSHKHRSEHWIVVEGTAKVTVEDDISFLKTGQSIYIPLGAKHRMENPGENPMMLIEVQTGTYLGEDDIIRYEDIYSRT